MVPLIAGVWMSKVIPGIGNQGDLIFGTPLILRFFEGALLHAAPADVYLHPVARAAWVGLLATALNLLPIGSSTAATSYMRSWAIARAFCRGFSSRR